MYSDVLQQKKKINFYQKKKHTPPLYFSTKHNKCTVDIQYPTLPNGRDIIYGRPLIRKTNLVNICDFVNAKELVRHFSIVRYDESSYVSH